MVLKKVKKLKSGIIFININKISKHIKLHCNDSLQYITKLWWRFSKVNFGLLVLYFLYIENVLSMSTEVFGVTEKPLLLNLYTGGSMVMLDFLSKYLTMILKFQSSSFSIIFKFIRIPIGLITLSMFLKASSTMNFATQEQLKNP